MAVLSQDSHGHEPSVLVLDLGTSQVLLNVGDEDRKHKLVSELREDMADVLFGAERNIVLGDDFIIQLLRPLFH